jgi:hypothetical protein
MTRQEVIDTFGPQDVDVVVLCSSPSRMVDDAAFATPVTQVLDAVAARSQVAKVQSFYTVRAPTLVSSDRHATYVAITLRAGDADQKLRDYQAVKESLRAGGVRRTSRGRRPSPCRCCCCCSS